MCIDNLAFGGISQYFQYFLPILNSLSPFCRGTRLGMLDLAFPSPLQIDLIRGQQNLPLLIKRLQDLSNDQKIAAVLGNGNDQKQVDAVSCGAMEAFDEYFWVSARQGQGLQQLKVHPTLIIRYQGTPTIVSCEQKKM